MCLLVNVYVRLALCVALTLAQRTQAVLVIVLHVDFSLTCSGCVSSTTWRQDSNRYVGACSVQKRNFSVACAKSSFA